MVVEWAGHDCGDGLVKKTYSVRFTILVHYVSTTHRTESCLILNTFTKININIKVTLGKTKVNVLLKSIFGISQHHHNILG